MLRSIYARKMLAILMLLCVHHNAHAEQDTITLEEVIQKTLDNSPLVSEIERKISFARADASDASTLNNPELEVAYGVPTTRVGREGKDELDLSLEQPLRFSDGPLRTRLADLIEEASSHENKKDILTLLIKVKLSYAKVWALTERKNVLQEASQQTALFSQFVKSGSQAGAYGEAEALLFRSENSKLRGMLKGIEAEQLLALAELSQTTGISFSGKTFRKPQLSELSISKLERKLDSGTTGMQRRLSILSELAKAESAVARRDAFPEFRPKLFYSKANDGADIFGVGISFDLPLYSQNSALRTKKKSEARVAATNVNFTRSDQFKEAILNSVKAYSLRREQVTLFQEEVLPSLKQALKTFEHQVRVGQGDILGAWQILREYVETDQLYLELWVQVFSEQNQLSLLLEEEI